jgi:hypothetical protein
MATDPLKAFMSSIWLGLNCLLQRVTLLVRVICVSQTVDPTRYRQRLLAADHVGLRRTMFPAHGGRL